MWLGNVQLIGVAAAGAPGEGTVGVGIAETGAVLAGGGWG